MEHARWRSSSAVPQKTSYQLLEATNAKVEREEKVQVALTTTAILRVSLNLFQDP